MHTFEEWETFDTEKKLAEQKAPGKALCRRDQGSRRQWAEGRRLEAPAGGSRQKADNRRHQGRQPAEGNRPKAPGTADAEGHYTYNNTYYYTYESTYYQT